jgi:hypothetical protein
MPDKKYSPRNASVKGLNEMAAALGEYEDDCIQARKDALQYYFDKIIIRHFLPGNQQAYNWDALDPAYQAWKFRHFGPQPMEVLTGALRDATITGRAVIQGKEVVAKLRLPGYASYQIAGGRDILAPNDKDEADVLAYFNKRLGEIRNKKSTRSKK